MSNYKNDLTCTKQYTSIENIIVVDSKSELELFEEIYKIAKYFKEELDYDTVPFNKLGFRYKSSQALLFTKLVTDTDTQKSMPYYIYGACVFNTKKFTKDGMYWVLKWIWIHPFFRNKGNLKKNWKVLENKFGNFLIEKPISKDMNKFINNINSKYEHIII